MMIQVSNVSEVCENRVCVEVVCGNREVYVSYHTHDYDFDRVTVILTNSASHKAFRGMGRGFETWEEAISSYKSADMKAAIEAAREAIEGHFSALSK